MNNHRYDITTLAQLEELAQLAASQLLSLPKAMVFLEGDLGVGKTTFSQMLLKSLGFIGHVQSPSYSIVNTYPVGQIQVAHADFYRLDSEESLSLIGWDIIIESSKIVLVEWADILDEEPDLLLSFKLMPSGKRTVEISGSWH